MYMCIALYSTLLCDYTTVLSYKDTCTLQLISCTYCPPVHGLNVKTSFNEILIVFVISLAEQPIEYFSFSET